MRIINSIFIFIFLSFIASQAKDLPVPKPFGIELRKMTKQEFHSKFGCKEKAFYYAGLGLDVCTSTTKLTDKGILNIEVAFLNGKVYGVTILFSALSMDKIEKAINTIEKKYRHVKTDDKTGMSGYEAGGDIGIFVQPIPPFAVGITYMTHELFDYINDFKRKKEERERKEFDENL